MNLVAQQIKLSTAIHILVGTGNDLSHIFLLTVGFCRLVELNLYTYRGALPFHWPWTKQAVTPLAHRDTVRGGEG